MGLEVKVLDLGDIELDTSFLVLGQDRAAQDGADVRLPHHRRGGADRRRHRLQRPEIMGNLGMQGLVRRRPGDGAGSSPSTGSSCEDVRYVLHTHLHIDHAG